MNSQPRGVRWTYLDFAAQLVRVPFHFRRPPALPRPSCISRVCTHSHIHARVRTHAGAYTHACTRAYTHTHARARARTQAHTHTRIHARSHARARTPRRRTALDGQRRREALRKRRVCNPHGHVTLDAPQVHSCTHMHARTAVGRRRRLHRETAIGIRANGRLCRGMDERADLQTHTQTNQRLQDHRTDRRTGVGRRGRAGNARPRNRPRRARAERRGSTREYSRVRVRDRTCACARACACVRTSSKDTPGVAAKSSPVPTSIALRM
jgi:hypothetical protein